MINVLVIAAHPDDEVLGCGGALARHILDGDDVFVLLMADGVTARYYDPAVSRKDELKKYGDEIRCRHQEMLQALAVLGIRSEKAKQLNFPDQRLDTLPLLQIIKAIEEVRGQFRPDIVYTHFWGDLNHEHRLVFDAVETAFRPQAGMRRQKLLCFEVPEVTDWRVPVAANLFTPNHFVDITRTLNKKFLALAAYESEARDYPHPRSARFLKERAKKWGGCIQAEFAEAFIDVELMRKNNGFAAGGV